MMIFYYIFSSKRDLLKLLTSNCLIDGKNIVITMKKPFAQMIETKGRLTWLAIIDELRTNSFDYIINFTQQLTDITTAVVK